MLKYCAKVALVILKRRAAPAWQGPAVRRDRAVSGGVAAVGLECCLLRLALVVPAKGWWSAGFKSCSYEKCSFMPTCTRSVGTYSLQCTDQACL